MFKKASNQDDKDIQDSARQNLPLIQLYLDKIKHYKRFSEIKFLM